MAAAAGVWQEGGGEGSDGTGIVSVRHVDGAGTMTIATYGCGGDGRRGKILLAVLGRRSVLGRQSTPHQGGTKAFQQRHSAPTTTLDLGNPMLLTPSTTESRAARRSASRDRAVGSHVASYTRSIMLGDTRGMIIMA